MVAAKGKANIGGITVGSKNVKIVLEISKRDFFKNAKFFESDPEEVDFVLGDMQMSISDYLASSSAPHQGLKAVVDRSGVVQSAEDGNQATILDQPDDSQENLQADQAAPNPDLELSFEDGYAPAADEQSADEGGTADGAYAADEDQGAGPDPSKEEVENHILQEKPRFDDVEFDPALFVEKIETNCSWMEIASKHGLSSTQLQASWGKYKKRVAQKLKRNGAA
ncbi:hypothetical protein PM3016_5462 [Paenibacillus mucilaginosus 3016]|uniref:Uncharacterized protein n=1 Tax=Paenibacillus mucilaginosus 3016 TaxID=1116391 RepID=H6NDW3_9BACL|nr:hypothetical protein [Paenibacillus mucilaginosus]AFC32162.1 hypothetical protein PM3016_5462 [Paenibacillus mucilaginosus 3016]WFA20660.1 hypothetical protein ERY13_27175 [Paenibacillus mucilaginosus]